ncbi:hypothetical protein HK103_000422 [Boothiomyces macroporosus]|uniref:Myb/SANT-like domain-containing protein n=1 Tax=Boothiomyces macroporosus TaxID=261099 RepID=A0AAD5UBG4_9FUNG|nr:hypothetical protein HK103_000422 [Boothiomyces macroporosus]
MTPSSSVVRQTIMEWLKIPENMRWITGFTDYVGQKRKKKDAFANLQQYINQRHSTQFNENEIKNKYLWMMRKYDLAREKAKTESDYRILKEICPYYAELNEIFGNMNYTSMDQLEDLFRDTPTTLFDSGYGEADYYDQQEPKKQKIDEYPQIYKENSIEIKRLELDAQFKLRERELQVQENVKKLEIKMARMQFVKEMVLGGKCKEEIKELLDLVF